MQGKTGMKKLAALLMSGILAFSYGTGALAQMPESENIQTLTTQEEVEESEEQSQESVMESQEEQSQGSVMESQEEQSQESVIESQEVESQSLGESQPVAENVIIEESQSSAEAQSVEESQTTAQELQESEASEYTISMGPLAAGTKEGDGFSVDGDVLVFDDMTEGTFYRIRLDLEPGIECGSFVMGGTYHVMEAILEDSSGNLSYWIRDHHCENNCRASLDFTIPEGKAMQFSLSPASAGTVSRVPGIPVLWVTLNQPATLVVTTSENTVVTNDQGASFVIGGTNDGYYSAMTLHTDVMEGEEGTQAANMVVAQLGEGSKAIAYDIYLVAFDERRQLLDGDTATVTLPVPQGWYAGDVVVYYVADDGTLTDMNAVPGADGTTVSFMTTHFSTYVIAQKEHVHGFGEWTDIGDGNHQRVCGCGAAETQAHVWDEGIVTTEATENEEGIRTYSCTVCGAVETEAIPVLVPETDVPETSGQESGETQASSETKPQTETAAPETQAVDANTPKTGDSMIPILWVSAMVLSAGGAGMVIYVKRGKTEREE